MRSFTNLGWPDDPYGTSQRMCTRKPRLLAAFAAVSADNGAHAIPIAYAVIYLRMHRTRTVPLDPATFAFGFRTAAAEGPGDAAALAMLFDLDLLRAREHAAILAAHSFLDDLHCMRQATPSTLRGVTAVLETWPTERRRGLARMVDIAGDGAATLDNLQQTCIQLGIAPASALRGLACPCTVAHHGDRHNQPGSVRWLAAAAVKKALIVGLIAGWQEGCLIWKGRMDITGALAREAGHELPVESGDRA